MTIVYDLEALQLRMRLERDHEAAHTFLLDEALIRGLHSVGFGTPHALVELTLEVLTGAEHRAFKKQLEVRTTDRSTPQPAVISATIKGIDLTFQTHPRLFSPREIDPGTLAMLSVVEFGPAEKVLDLGCGYGVVGILAAKLIGPDKVTMVDSDPLAAEFARINATLNGVVSVRIIQSDCYENLDDSEFNAILVNPPYHADFSVPKCFIERGFNRLVLGGRIVLVVKRRKWYENKLRAVFGGVRIQTVGRYFVMTSERRSERWAT